MITVLLGYMASGKSSIGRLVAEKMNYDFIDLDAYIEEKEGQEISRIFKTKGEIYFRKKETLYLVEVLDNNSNLILSLGGGTPCYSSNMNTILDNKNTKSFYLKTSISEIIDRVGSEKNKRPLIAHLHKKDELIEFIGKHLFERTPYYNLANHQITTDKKQIEVISNEIIELL